MPENSIYDQSSYDIRSEWGLHGLETLAKKVDVIIIVDTLSFSTCVDVAVGRGAIIYPYRFRDETAHTYARLRDAEIAGPRSEGGYSLSPKSFANVEPGARVVLPSPNGATLSVAAGEKPTIAGCLRNATAVASAAMKLGNSIAVIPAGEHWHNDTLRPSIEDILGVGAIIHALHGSSSPEADAARLLFEQFEHSILETLLDCVSGRELTERGYETDVHYAADYNISNAVPILSDGAYVNHAKQPTHI